MFFKRHENGTLNPARFQRPCKLLEEMAPQAGLEPATLRLTEEAGGIHGVISSMIEVTE